MPIIYELREDHACVRGYNGACKDVIIPSSLRSFPVTEIGDHAFEDRVCLERIILLCDLRKIGAGTFRGCKRLRCFGCPDDDFLAELFGVLENCHTPDREASDLDMLLLDGEEDFACSIPPNMDVGSDAFKGTPLEKSFSSNESIP